MNSDDARELDEIEEALAALQARSVELARGNYVDAGDVAAVVAEALLLVQALVRLAAYDARERETEPGDR